MDFSRIIKVQEDAARNDFKANCKYETGTAERSSAWRVIDNKMRKVLAFIQDAHNQGVTQNNVRRHICSEAPAGGVQRTGESFFDHIINTWIDLGVLSMDETP